MSSLIKPYNRVMIVSIVILITVAYLPTVTFAESSSTDKTLDFLEDVVNLDVAKYDVTLVTSIVRNPPELGGLVQETTKYSLETGGSRIDVLVKFRNGVLSWCLMDVQEGSLLYRQQLSMNVRDNVQSFLQSYQEYTGDSDLTKMGIMLNTVDNVTSTTKIADNLKLEIKVDSHYTSFEWRQVFDGAAYSGLSVSYQNGSFCTFSDDRSYYKIGGTDISVNEDEAKTIALEHAKKISWTHEGKEVTDFNITEERITRVAHEKQNAFNVVSLLAGHFAP